MSQTRTRTRTVTVREHTPLAQVQNTGRPPAVSKETQKNTEEDITKSLGFGERMLRNTALCVALLLCIVAVQSLNTPGAVETTNFLSDVVSMNLSESLGSLRFVSNLIPDSVAVFWNLGGEKFAIPTDADVIHVFGTQEPWVGYAAGVARASAPGEVMSLAIESNNKASVRVRHASGMETIYGNLLTTSVQEGDWLETGDVIGAARELTFELRGEGRPMDPAPYFK